MGVAAEVVPFSFDPNAKDGEPALVITPNGGMNCRQIADCFGVTKAGINRIERMALRKLEVYFRQNPDERLEFEDLIQEFEELRNPHIQTKVKGQKV